VALVSLKSASSFIYIGKGAGHVQSDKTDRYARDQRKVRQIYQKLAAAWWNWALQFPEATNPVVDATGEFCHLGQEGLVWFLAGTFGGAATRT
jgi:hypothetical protein